jgi:hypothetical protein
VRNLTNKAQADRLNQFAAAAAEAREALVPLWEQHPAAAETFRFFSTASDRMTFGDWRRLITEFQFANRFGLSERDSEIIFAACSSNTDDSSEPCLSISEFCTCLIQVAHLSAICPKTGDANASSRQGKSRALAAICHFLQNPDATIERDAAMALQLVQVSVPPLQDCTVISTHFRFYLP